MAIHPKQHRFHWFGSESVLALRDRINACIEEYGVEALRLEVHQVGDDMNLWPSGDGDPIDQSHVCPIDCPPQ